MKNRFKLMRGDCLKRMKEIPDNSVDFILCDLPYGMTQNKWDVVIPFDDLWQQYNRICKISSVIVLFACQPFTSVLITSNIKCFKYDWVWKKTGKPTGHLNAKIQPLRDKEDILVFYRKPGIYNPQFTVGKPYKNNKAGNKPAGKSSMTSNYGNFSNFRNANSGNRYPRQVIEMPRVERGTLHPTQKPVALCEYLIKTYTNEGNVVLDNCMGSGTTGVAALNIKRKFIGIEKDKTYYKIASKRIRESLK